MNYLIIHKTGRAAYSTSAKAYKIVKNKPVFIGEIFGSAEDCMLSYLCDCFKSAGKNRAFTEKIVQKYRASKINIYQL